MPAHNSLVNLTGRSVTALANRLRTLPRPLAVLGLGQPRVPGYKEVLGQAWRDMRDRCPMWVRSTASIFLFMCFPVGGMAGECTEPSDHYLTVIEQLAQHVRAIPRGAVYEAFSCLACSTDDWGRWAGPNAAAHFEECRRSPIRDRLLAACGPLLDDTTHPAADDFVPRFARTPRQLNLIVSV